MTEVILERRVSCAPGEQYVQGRKTLRFVEGLGFEALVGSCWIFRCTIHGEAQGVHGSWAKPKMHSGIAM